mgnify:CR=1 FL=1
MIGNRITNEQAIKYTATAAAVTGVATGAAEALRQNKIFKNADTFIAQAEGAMKIQARFCNSFHMGTQEAADLALKNLQDNFEKFKNFALSKKFDFRSIGKAGLIGAGIIGGLTALGCFVYNIGKKELQDDAKIVANEFKDTKVEEK